MTLPKAPLTGSAFSLKLETPEDGPAVEALIGRAFGPGRYAKAAERLREGRQPLLDLSHVAWQGEAIVGCCRMWSISIGAAPALLLGPFAVEPEWRSLGLGAALIEAACAAAEVEGHGLIFLVGDAPYFEPMGFTIAPPGRLVMPGPVDPRRMMLKALKPSAAEGLEGPILPA
jgi:predicted N-acetyltransferase YhbS